MKRVAIIGPGGAGKSAMARELGDILDIEVIHLDGLYWKPGWVETPGDEWERIQRDLVTRDEWVIDGNYGGTMEIRLQAADTIVFLDMPRMHCILHGVKRRWMYRGVTRPDMGPGCPEKVDLMFLRWIWNYPRRRRPGILNLLSRYQNEKPVHILQSHAEIREFLDDVRQRHASQVAVDR